MMSKRTLVNVVCFALFAVLPASAATRASVWTAVAASRGVEARPATAVTADDWRDVRRGDELASRTFVRTGRRGRATLTRHGSVLIVDPGSHIELPEPGAGGVETSIIQSSGSVMYEVDRRDSRHFEVVTPHLVAGVKGTSFLVTVESGFTAVTVESGLVEVFNPANGDSTDLGPGQSVFLDREEQRLDHVDLREAQPPRARTEVKRLVKMERREERRLQRETRAGDGPHGEGEPGVAVENGGHDGEKEDWVTDADLPGTGDDDWKDVDDAHWGADDLDGGSLDGNGLDGTRTGVVGADPIDLPEVPEDDPVGSGKTGGTEKVDPVN
jgi:hypothetical protein